MARGLQDFHRHQTSLPPIRIGIAGSGRIVRLAHLKALQSDPRARVVAVGDPDPGARPYLTQHAPTATYFPSFEAMLSDAELDAVVIAVPALLHLAAASLAFDRGLHVYLEKPIAASVEDGEAIVAAWRRAGTIGRIGFNCRFNALYRELQVGVAGGRIGNPVAVRTALTACWPAEATWRLSPSGGGGALLELASHHVDLLRFVFGTEIADVSAASWSNRGDDEAAMLQLTLANGVHVQTLVTYGTAEEDRFEVYGSDGKLVIDRYNSLVVEQVPLRATGGIAASIRRAAREVRALPYGLVKGRAPGQEPSFAASLHAFISAIRDGRDGSPTLEDGLASLRVIDAARQTTSAVGA